MPATISTSTTSRCSAPCRTSTRCRSATRSSAVRCSSASIARSEITLRRVVSERRLGGLRSAGATLVAAIALAVILIQAPGRAAARTVTFRTDDGVMLTGTWYETGRQAPAVVLVHMQHRTRKDWDAL